MSLVLALNDIKPEHRRPLENGKTGLHTDFFEATVDNPVQPTAFLVEYDPGSSSGAHFHEVDQFQIIVSGKGTFGRHDVSSYCVHFTRAYTPYGPLHSESGWAFLTLRTRYDSGSQREFEKLKQNRNRTPWQRMKKADFPDHGPDVKLQAISELGDDQGLYVGTLIMAPHARTTAPDPSNGDGQYIAIVKGSVLHEGKEHTALALAFVKPGDGAFQLQAGAQGLEALILNFPQIKPRMKDRVTPSAAIGFRKWQCALCAFVYDEAKGMPQDGIAAGTRWQDVPDNWNCPDCSANKSDFEMVAL